MSDPLYGMNLKVHQSPMMDELEVYLFQRDPTGATVVTEMKGQHVPPGAPLNRSFSMEPTAVQELFNQLWTLGYRPKDGTGNAGHLAAVQYHLEDMRKLVFQKWGIEP